MSNILASIIGFLALGVIVLALIIVSALGCFTPGDPAPAPPQPLPPPPPVPLLSGSLVLGTYNILTQYVCATDTAYSWTARKDFVVANISQSNVDVLALQEVTFQQHTDLVAALPAFSSVIYQRPGMDEYAVVFFRTDQLNLLQADGGAFVASPNEGFPRAYVWLQLEHVLTKQVFYFYGTHMPTKAYQDLQRAITSELAALIDQQPKALGVVVGADWNSGGEFKADQQLVELLNLQGRSSFVVSNAEATHFDLDKDTCRFVPPVTPAGNLDSLVTSLPALDFGLPAVVSPGWFHTSTMLQYPASDHSLVAAKMKPGPNEKETHVDRQ